MIGRLEIMAVSGDLSLRPDVVEKDYVLGWILAGICADPRLSQAWAFKGGQLQAGCELLRRQPLLAYALGSSPLCSQYQSLISRRTSPSVGQRSLPIHSGGFVASLVRQANEWRWCGSWCP